MTIEKVTKQAQLSSKIPQASVFFSLLFPRIVFCQRSTETHLKMFNRSGKPDNIVIQFVTWDESQKM